MAKDRSNEDARSKFSTTAPGIDEKPPSEALDDIWNAAAKSGRGAVPFLRQLLKSSGWTLNIQGWSHLGSKLTPLIQVHDDRQTKELSEVEEQLAAFSIAEAAITQSVAVRMRLGIVESQQLQVQVQGGSGPGKQLLLTIDEFGRPNRESTLRLIEALSQMGLRTFRNRPLGDHADAIARTMKESFWDVLLDLDRKMEPRQGAPGGARSKAELLTVDSGIEARPIAGVAVLYHFEPETREFRDFLTSLLPTIVRGSLVYHGTELYYLLRRAQTRSAIATVMGRVNAHDIGHVLAAATLPKNGDDAKFFFQHLVQYIRRRMIFAAEVSAVNPSWSTSMQFVSQVLSPFQYYQSRTKLYPSAVCSFLAKSENVKEVGVEAFLDGEGPLFYDFDPETSHWSAPNGDFAVDIPSGLIGAHALYCIFENVIRNGAKYGDVNEEDSEVGRQKLTLHISSKEEQGYYRVVIFDDHSRVVEPTIHHEVFRFFPPNDLPGWYRPDGKTARVDDWSLVDEEGKLNGGGFGIKEMRICAAWLRAESPVDALVRNVHDGPLEKPLLKPIYVTANGTEVTNPEEPQDECVFLGYEFFLARPRKAVVMETDRAANPSKGVDSVPSLDDYLEQPARHELAVFHHIEDLKPLGKQRSRLPSRAVLIADKGPSSELSPIAVLPTADFKRELEEELLEGNARALAEMRFQWLRAIAGTRAIELELMLHLAPSKSAAAPKHVVDDWHRTADFVQANNLGWTMTVVGEGACKPRGAKSRLVYDYHSRFAEWSKVHDETVDFHEVCGGTSGGQQVLFNPPKDEDTRLAVAVELLEAAVLRVAVVDERLWNTVGIPPKGGDRRRQDLANMGIFVPPEYDEGCRAVINYARPSVEKLSGLTNYLRDKDIDILSIHQGMIDKMAQNKDEADKRVGELKRAVRILVVHSDRGEGMRQRRPDDTRFIPYSAIEQWLIDPRPSKYHIVQVLVSARSRHPSSGPGARAR